MYPQREVGRDGLSGCARCGLRPKINGPRECGITNKIRPHVPRHHAIVVLARSIYIYLLVYLSIPRLGFPSHISPYPISPCFHCFPQKHLIDFACFTVLRASSSPQRPRPRRPPPPPPPPPPEPAEAPPAEPSPPPRVGSRPAEQPRAPPRRPGAELQVERSPLGRRYRRGARRAALQGAPPR